MGLSGNQKAIMYALGGLARGGATRGGYHSGLPYVSIGGAVMDRVLVTGLSVHDILDETPDTCQLTVMDTAAPSPGADLVITLGSINSGTRKFAGKIISEAQGYLAQKPANVYHGLNGIDYTWLLGQHLVIRQYTNQTVAFIATDLIASFAEGMTTNHIAADAGAIFIDAISFTNVALADALSQLCSRAGAYWYLDYFRDLHLFETEPTTIYPNPTPLTPAHPSLADLTVQQDLSQIVTRALVEGGGGLALVDLQPGETIIPVDTIGWYQAGGGQVTIAPQRIKYAGLAVGGAGALIGPGVTPATAPGVAPASGAGVDAGTHGYAYSWVTAAGQTMPSPSGAGATQAPTAAPTTALVASPPTASGAGYVEPGTYDYVITYSVGTSAGETDPGPISNAVTTTPANGVIPLTIPVSPAGTYKSIYRRKNGSGSFFRIVTNMANSQTSYGDGTPNAYVGASAPTANTTGAGRLTVSGISVGPAAVTQRKLYRTVAGGTQLKLVATLADNTTTTFLDTQADASLGANAPVADTSGLQQATGTIPVGSSSLPLASMPPAFAATGGWAIVGNGQLVIRYTGIAGNSLTGIPPSGVGAITTTVAFGAMATAAPELLGIPASGPGAILYPLHAGDELNLLVTCDDLGAQTQLAAFIGGSGIKEAYIQDRRIGYTEATARGQAMLADRSKVLIEVRYTCRDPLTRSGATIHCAMPAPTNLTGDFKIQDVTIANFSAKPGQPPTYTVLASSQRYSLDDLLRQARGTIGA